MAPLEKNRNHREKFETETQERAHPAQPKMPLLQLSIHVLSTAFQVPPPTKAPFSKPDMPNAQDKYLWIQGYTAGETKGYQSNHT